VARQLSRGRRLAFGLALLLQTACAVDGDGRPAGEPNAAYAAPAIAEVDGIRNLEIQAPREILYLYDVLPAREVQLLFLSGRASTALPDGGVAWADKEGARVVLFDRMGAVAGVLQGTSPDGRALAGPVSVAADTRGVLAVEPDGSALVFKNGRPVEWLGADLPGPLGGSSRAGSAAARTYLEFALAPVRPDDPLLWFQPAEGGEPRPIGTVKVPERSFMGQLANAGWVAVGSEGDIYFASALEPEIRRFDRSGKLEWISRWPTPEPIPAPRFATEAGSLSPKFTIVQHGVVLSPDGLAYVLASAGSDTEDRRLLVFDDHGELVRAVDVPADGALFVDRGGRVFSIPLAEALSRTEASTRAAFQPFDLLALNGSGMIDLESYRGRVVVVNFWASWCAPCRKEMPILSEFAAELDPAEAVVIGLNEDIKPADGIRFVEELGGVSYRSAAGEGRLRDRYYYRGLPYTVVLDRELRVVKSFYGFGRTVDPIRETVMRELGTPRDGATETPGGPLTDAATEATGVATRASGP